MHRLLVAPALLESATPALPHEAARHLKVLRPKPGETIELFDGCGRHRLYHYDAAAKILTDPEALLVDSSPRTATPLTLFAAITKGSRWDWTLEKATELGVARIVPVITARTIVRIPDAERTAKRERYQRIAEDAARQSDALWLPEILAPTDFMQALVLARQTTCFIGALTTPPSPPLVQALQQVNPTGPISVFIGPEGDFTPDELAALIAFAHPTSFGPTILRAETAALFAISAIMAWVRA